MLVKNGAIIAISNKYGDTPLSKARPRLRKKLEALAGEFGQSLVIVPHKSKSHIHTLKLFIMALYLYISLVYRNEGNQKERL